MIRKFYSRSGANINNSNWKWGKYMFNNKLFDLLEERGFVF